MAVIFDFNGTLVFDTPIQVRAWDETARARYGRGVGAAEYARKLSGLSNADTAAYLAGHPVTPEEAEACGRQKEALYFALAAGPDFRLVPGAPAYLDALLARGVPFTIATSAGRDNMDRYFSLLGLSRWFSREAVLCRDERLPGKPDPAVFLAAMRSLGVSPRQTLVFEDSPAGLTAAVRSGARVAAIAGTLDEDSLRAIPGVSYVLRSYDGAPLDA